MVISYGLVHESFYRDNLSELIYPYPEVYDHSSKVIEVLSDQVGNCYLKNCYLKLSDCCQISLLTLSRRRPLLYRNQSIDLRSKSMDWFVYDNGLRLERVKIERILANLLSTISPVIITKAMIF